MAETRVMPLRRPPRIVEGTRAEIEAHLRTLGADRRLTLIIPDEHEEALEALLAPLQRDFEAGGMTEGELGDLIDSEVRASRASRASKEPEPGA